MIVALRCSNEREREGRALELGGRRARKPTWGESIAEETEKETPHLLHSVQCSPVSWQLCSFACLKQNQPRVSATVISWTLLDLMVMVVRNSATAGRFAFKLLWYGTYQRQQGTHLFSDCRAKINVSPGTGTHAALPQLAFDSIRVCHRPNGDRQSSGTLSVSRLGPRMISRSSSHIH
jgi:hypothetical protein